MLDERTKKSLQDIELCNCRINQKGKWIVESDGDKPVRVYRCQRCYKRIYAKIQ